MAGTIARNSRRIFSLLKFRLANATLPDNNRVRFSDQQQGLVHPFRTMLGLPGKEQTNMSTVRHRINVLSMRESSECRNILFRDQLHGRQLFLDGLRQRRECRNRHARGAKLRDRIELTLIMTGAFMLMGILAWLCT